MYIIKIDNLYFNNRNGLTSEQRQATRFNGRFYDDMRPDIVAAVRLLLGADARYVRLVPKRAPLADAPPA